MEKEAIREIFRSNQQPHGFKDMIEKGGEKSVGIYMRVAAPDDSFLSILEVRKQFYRNLLKSFPNLRLYKFYVDEGVCGLNAFNEMMNDAYNHLLHLVVTSSLSDFSKSVADGIKTTKKLARLSPSVGVLFIGDHLFSLDEQSQKTLELIQMVSTKELAGSENE